MPPTPPHRPAHGAPRAPTAPHQRTGALGEDLACRYLVARGYEVVARNWRAADGDLRGELDVIALDHHARQVVVVEVKTRRGDGYGGALAAITPRKQAAVRRLGLAFLVEAELPYREVRFDAVAIRLDLDPPAVEHVPGAF